MVRTLQALAKQPGGAEGLRARAAGVSRRRPAQCLPRAPEREPGRARSAAQARRRQLVARAPDRRATDVARRAARCPRVRHAAVARGARGAARARDARRRGDVEAMLDAIRVFQRTAIFRIAVADRLGSLPLMKVSDRLTDTAELVLDYSLRAALAGARREVRHAALRPAAARSRLRRHRLRQARGTRARLRLGSRSRVPARLERCAAGNRRRAAARQRALLRPPRAAAHSLL